MSAFVAPLVLGGGRVPMMSILIQQQMTLLLNWPAGAAQAIVLVALVSLLLLGYVRVLREAPMDDEPKTDEERQLVEEARQDLAAGRVVSHEEIRREFGLE